MAVLRSLFPLLLLFPLVTGCTGTIESVDDGSDGNSILDGTDAGADPGADTAGRYPA